MPKSKAILIIWFGLLLAFPALAAEKINGFTADILINADATIEVSETIVYDFGDAEKHGIYRELPYRYSNARGNYRLRFDDISVADQSGQAQPFSVTSADGKLNVKIGDPEVLVSGSKTYVIRYRVARAVNNFADHDELYWNVTGSDWQVAIENAQANVYLPVPVDPARLSTACFAGSVGSTAACDKTGQRSVGGGNDAVEFGQAVLGPGEDFTVVVGLPKGLLAAPRLTTVLWENFTDNGIVLLPLLVLFLMFYFWYSRGRDPEGRGIVIPQYDVPDGLSPAEVGTILDERVDGRDITADIIHLAVKGYLKIRQTEVKGLLSSSEDYELIKLKDWRDLESDSERKMMLALFRGRDRVRLSELKNTFYEDLRQIRSAVYRSVTSKGYFRRNPNSVRIFYVIVGAILASLGPLLPFSGYLAAASFVLSGLVVIVFSLLMPARTKRGVETREYILGLKNYLSVAERDRLHFHNAPQARPETFEKFLPFALVLKVEKDWARQFEGIYQSKPAWFEGEGGAAFNAAVLASSLGNFSTKAVHTLAASAARGGSGLSGGGFSGGGFGGGGGGSW